MDYDKMYFPKTEMLQLVPPPVNNSTLITTDDTYSAYADNFDLSLLPNETELPLSPQSDFSSSSSLSLSPSASSSTSTSTSTSSSSSSTASESPSRSAQVSLDYIPTTIYHDQTVTQIKIEKPWSDDTTPATPATSHQQRLSQHSSTTLNRTNSFLLEQLHHHYKLYPSPQPSPPSQDHFHHSNGPASIYPPSPCPSIDAKHHHHHHHQQHQQHPQHQHLQQHQIKQEYHILPPSPPESSCGAPSPHSFADIKQEPDEALIDINSLLENSLRHDTITSTTADSKPPQQDHQLLREYLEDTTFQKKHNLKPLALESLIGGLGVRGDIEPVISLALEHAKREAEETCTKLQISADPQKWTPAQVHAWLRSTVEQFKLPPINDLELKFPEDGTTLSLLTEEEFVRRAPEAGGTIHAQLEIWKLACSDNFPNDFNANPTHNNNNNSTSNTSVTTPSIATTAIWNSECIQNMDMDVSDDEDEEILPPGTVNSSPAMASTTATTGGTSTTPIAGAKPPTGRTGGSHIHLWQFLKELLATPHVNGTAIRWIDRSKGVFKIEDSVRVAKLWGRRKNRPAMNYDKLSRSIRQYYKKGIMKKTERSQRLVYQFCHPYSL